VAVGQRFLDLLGVLTRHWVRFLIVGATAAEEATVLVLALDAVIESKEAAGRPKDRAALPQLREALRLRG
jgi:hypothetical protein